jgi:predicted DCC family thiol-disulfide oxidoreductase YuxK
MREDGEMSVTPRARPIVFFDGCCPLCNRFVAALASRDRRGVFLFAPIQGKTASQVLAPSMIADLRTVILWDEKGFSTKSTAVLRIATQLGGAYRLLEVFRIVPVSVRDRVYDWIARHRHQWFGRSRRCPIPARPMQGRLLS